MLKIIKRLKNRSYPRLWLCFGLTKGFQMNVALACYLQWMYDVVYVYACKKFYRVEDRANATHGNGLPKSMQMRECQSPLGAHFSIFEHWARERERERQRVNIIVINETTNQGVCYFKYTSTFFSTKCVSYRLTKCKKEYICGTKEKKWIENMLIIAYIANFYYYILLLTWNQQSLFSVMVRRNWNN